MACASMRATVLCTALLCLSATAMSDSPSTFEDGVIDDLGIDALVDPDENGEMIHEDSNHMSKADVASASKVFDVLFPTEDDDDEHGDLGEGASVGNPLEDARSARKEATKALLAAKGEGATKKAEETLKSAEQGVEKAKMSSLGSGAVTEAKKKAVAEGLSRAEAQESSARNKVLSAKGMKETEAATNSLESAKTKVEKEKEKAAALGMKQGKPSAGDAQKTTVFEAKVRSKVKATTSMDKYEKQVMKKAK